jgi:hypothetical protein
LTDGRCRKRPHGRSLAAADDGCSEAWPPSRGIRKYIKLHVGRWRPRLLEKRNVEGLVIHERAPWFDTTSDVPRQDAHGGTSLHLRYGNPRPAFDHRPARPYGHHGIPVTYAYAAATNGFRALLRRPGPSRALGARQPVACDDPNLHCVLQTFRGQTARGPRMQWKMSDASQSKSSARRTCRTP